MESIELPIDTKYPDALNIEIFENEICFYKTDIASQLKKRQQWLHTWAWIFFY